jgi:hypothetical protein
MVLLQPCREQCLFSTVPRKRKNPQVTNIKDRRKQLAWHKMIRRKQWCESKLCQSEFKLVFQPLTGKVLNM